MVKNNLTYFEVVRISVLHSLFPCSVCFHQPFQILLLSYHPYRVILIEALIGCEHRQVLLTFLHTDNHTVVDIPDATFGERLSKELSVFADYELSQFHLSSLCSGLRDEGCSSTPC